MKGKARQIQQIFSMQPPPPGERDKARELLKQLGSGERTIVVDNLQFLGYGKFAKTVVAKAHKNLDHLRAAIYKLVEEADAFETNPAS